LQQAPCHHLPRHPTRSLSRPHAAATHGRCSEVVTAHLQNMPMDVVQYLEVMPACCRCFTCIYGPWFRVSLPPPAASLVASRIVVTRPAAAGFTHNTPSTAVCAVDSPPAWLAGLPAYDYRQMYMHIGPSSVHQMLQQTGAMGVNKTGAASIATSHRRTRGTALISTATTERLATSLRLARPATQVFVLQALRQVQVCASNLPQQKEGARQLHLPPASTLPTALSWQRGLIPLVLYLEHAPGRKMLSGWHASSCHGLARPSAWFPVPQRRSSCSSSGHPPHGMRYTIRRAPYCLLPHVK